MSEHIKKAESKMPSTFSLDDVYDAVKYGFDYSVNSQNDGSVPKGNILQWLAHKKNINL